MASYTLYGPTMAMDGMDWQPVITYTQTSTSTKITLSDIKLWFRVKGTTTTKTCASAVLRIAKAKANSPLSGTYNVKTTFRNVDGTTPTQTSTVNQLMVRSKLAFDAGKSYSAWTSPEATVATFSGNSFGMWNECTTITSSISYTKASETLYFSIDIGYCIIMDAAWGAYSARPIQNPIDANNNQCTIPMSLSKYTISYNANNGSGAPNSQIKYYSEALTLSTTKPTRTNYVFKNWNTKADGSGTSYASGGSYTANAAATLYAQWYAPYTISYNANGGSGAPSSQTKVYNTTLTLSTTTPTRTGYTFKNWNTKADGSGTSYASGGSYTANAAATLYAQWTINTYTVSYNANNGSGAPNSQTKTYGTPLILSTTKPTRTNYVFKNWNTKADGSGTSYASGGSYTANAAATLYAQWELVTYKVTYNANGGIGAPSAQYKQHGIALTLTSSKPTRTNCTFSKWNTKADGSGTSYASGGSYTANAAITLYAIWIPDPVISSLTVTRCTSNGTLDDEGTYCKVTAKWSLDQSVNSAIQSAAITGKYGKKGSSSTTNFTFSSGSSGGGSVTSTTIFSSVDTDSQYTITITVAYTNSTWGGKSTVKSAILTAAAFVIDLKAGGTAIGLGQAAPSSGLGIGLLTYFNRGIYLEHGNYFYYRNGIADISADSIESNVEMDILFRDKNDRNLGYLQAYQFASSGMSQMVLAARHRNSDNTANIDNTIRLRVNANGDRTVLLSEAAPWHDALELDTNYRSLAHSIAIPDQSNLNDIVNTGTYYAGSTAASGISNCPVTGAFKLIVERSLNTNLYLKQHFSLFDSTLVWHRYSTDGGSTWSSWYRDSAKTNSASTANRFLATPNGSAGLSSYRAIANADLPTVDAAHGGTGQTTLSDAQEALANALSTESVALTDSEQFIIREVGSTTKWHRRSLSALWNYIKGKASDIFPLLVGGTALASTDNLDNIKDVGTYYVTGSSSTPQNAPTGFYVGKVIVDIPHGLSSSSIRGQHYISYSSGREAYRKFESGSWSDWTYEYPRGPRSPQTYDVKSLITQTSTQSGNFSISSASLIVSGYVGMLTVDFTVGAALAANTEYSIGTLNSSIRPAGRANAGVGDSRWFASIASGTLYLRPQAATSAGTATYRYNSTYIMSNLYTG